MNSATVPPTQSEALSASVQLLPLPAGLYLFSVKAASAVPSKTEGQLQLPAMHVGLGPGVRSEQVEFVTGPSTDGAWLFANEDCLITKVTSGNAILVLTSVRAPGGETLSIKVERLDGRTEALPVIPAAALGASPAAAPGPKRPPRSARMAQERPRAVPRVPAAAAALKIEISAHIRSRGDMTFTGASWAGRVAPGLWIESFAVRPLEQFGVQDIEYKGLTGSGFETPWLSDSSMCGTKGMAVPLVGFAIRLRPSREAAAFECEYSGYFKSGATVGPLRNGAPCRSTVANDPLEGIQVHIRKRAGALLPVVHSHRAAKNVRAEPSVAARVGPSFGHYRDPPAGAAMSAGALEPVRKSKLAGDHAVKARRQTNGASAAKHNSARRP